MRKIATGRALVVLLLGATDMSNAAWDAVGAGLPWGLEILLRAGLDLNEGEGETLIHHAVTKGEAACVKVLLAAGADPNRKDEDGETALRIAKKKKKPAVLRALEEGTKGAGKHTTSKPAQRLDSSGLIAAAKKLPAKSLKLWGSLFGEDDATKEFAETLDAVAASHLEDWSDLFNGALRDRLPWQRLALASAARSLTDKASPPENLGEEPRFVVGSLTIEGSLVLSAPLVVAGDLSVTGVIVDDDHAGSLVVAGNLSAAAIVTQNDLLVSGDCNVEQFVFASGNDHPLMVAGAFTTPLLVDDGHAIEANTDAVRETVAADAALVKKRFPKGALGDGSLSPEKLAKLVRAGKAVFK